MRVLGRKPDYRNRILTELGYEQTQPRRRDGKPWFYDLMCYCGVPNQDYHMNRFRVNLNWLVVHNYVEYVCLEKNDSGESVVGYYRLPLPRGQHFRNLLKEK